VVFESPVWLGVRSAHTLWYVSDKQRDYRKTFSISRYPLSLFILLDFQPYSLRDYIFFLNPLLRPPDNPFSIPPTLLLLPLPSPACIPYRCIFPILCITQNNNHCVFTFLLPLTLIDSTASSPYVPKHRLHNPHPMTVYLPTPLSINLLYHSATIFVS